MYSNTIGSLVYVTCAIGQCVVSQSQMLKPGLVSHRRPGPGSRILVAPNSDFSAISLDKRNQIQIVTYLTCDTLSDYRIKTLAFHQVNVFIV